MDSTCLTVGGFSQPSVARALIEQSGSAEIGLSQRFMWLFPQPSYARFETLEGVDSHFTSTLGKGLFIYHSLSTQLNTRNPHAYLHLAPVCRLCMCVPYVDTHVGHWWHLTLPHPALPCCDALLSLPPSP